MNDCIEIIVEKTEIEVEVRDGEVTIDPLRHDCVSHVAMTEEHDVVVDTPQQPCVEVKPKQDPCVCPDVQQTEMEILSKGDLEKIVKGLIDIDNIKNQLKEYIKDNVIQSVKDEVISAVNDHTDEAIKKESENLKPLIYAGL